MQYQVLLDPAQDRRHRPLGARRRRRPRRQQRQRRRRLLLAGRAVLLRARARPPDHPGGHRQRRARRPQRHPGAGQGRRRGGDRAGAAPRPVRLQRSRRGRRGRRPDADGRAGPGRAPEDRAEDPRAQRIDPAAGRQDPSLLRSPRPDRADHPHGRGQPAARHAPGRRRAHLLPLRPALRPDRRRDHSARSAVRLHLPRPQARTGQPAVDRRHRLRHPGRRRGGDGGEHLPPAGAARGEAVQDPRGDPRGGRRGRPADRLRRGGDHGGIPPDLRALGRLGRAVQADGGHHPLRPPRIAHHHPDAAAGALRLGAPQGGPRAAQRHLRGDQERLYPGARRLSAPPLGHDGRLGAPARRLAPADPGYRRRVHAASGRGRALDPRHHAGDHLVRGGGEDLPPGAERSCAPSPRSPRSPTSSAGRTTAPTRPASSTTSSSSA